MTKRRVFYTIKGYPKHGSFIDQTERKLEVGQIINVPVPDRPLGHGWTSGIIDAIEEIE